MIGDHPSALATVRASDGVLTVHPRHVPVDLAAYSRFKYGDALVALEFATGLAELALRAPVLDRVRGDLVVAVPGYDVAPPAAASLREPFMGELQARRPDVRVRALHVRRRRASPGDFASMSRAERADALTSHDLEVVDEVRGCVVVVLDDVRVTGTHERAMDRALRRAGAACVVHLYVLAAESDDPSIEAQINRVAVSSVADMGRLAAVTAYTPNARVLRALLTSAPGELDAFFAHAPVHVRTWVEHVVATDEIASSAPYIAGADRLRSALRGVAAREG